MRLYRSSARRVGERLRRHEGGSSGDADDRRGTDDEEHGAERRREDARPTEREEAAGEDEGGETDARDRHQREERDPSPRPRIVRDHPGVRAVGSEPDECALDRELPEVDEHEHGEERVGEPLRARARELPAGDEMKGERREHEDELEEHDEVRAL